MNDNTILRIKVPANLYESVKEQLTINEAVKAKAHYGAGMEVVKEKKMKVPKDGMKKVEEIGGAISSNPSDMGINVADAPGGMVTKETKEKDNSMEKKPRTLDELKKAKAQIDKKIEEMEMASKNKVEEGLDEIDPKFQGAMDVLSSIPGVDKIAQIDPFLAGVTLVGLLAGGLIAAPKIENGIKALMAMIKDPKKKAQLAAAAEKEGVGV